MADARRAADLLLQHRRRQVGHVRAEYQAIDRVPLDDFQRGVLLATPLLSGSLLRLVLGPLADHIGARRTALLSWAQARGAIVVEDDYDSEFRYSERPLEPLQQQ